MFLTILIFVLVLGLLIFVHELGHFLTARRNGIMAHEFGFGFPPRIVGVVKDDTTGRYRVVLGNQHVDGAHTVYSLNWIPLGGFVRIKGEDQSHADEPDSFAGKSAWIRFKVLAAGVGMNFLLAWVLFSIVLTLGFPQALDPKEAKQYPVTSVQISRVAKGSPAETMGLLPGDILLFIAEKPVTNLSMVSETISSKRGEQVAFVVERGTAHLSLSGTPRLEAPAGQGALGIEFSETAVVAYPWYAAIWQGLLRTFNLTVAILVVLGTLIAGIFTGFSGSLDVAGPIGIVLVTKQMSELGFVYLLQFAAVLSINLGIINALPIPALDGGRMLFVLIEKLRGRAVSRETEGKVHQIGFVILLMLMVAITIHDLLQFNLFEIVTRWF